MTERLRARMAAEYDPDVLQSASESRRRSGSSTHRPVGRYGSIPDIPVGAKWATREDCYQAGMHIKIRAGISGTAEGGAYSIVLSGGYEDDDDEGDHLIYTGTGGRGDAYGEGTKQISDQDWDHKDNVALMTSYVTGKVVRVIRGANEYSPWAPASGYRYDGLYKVTKTYSDIGKSGFQVCKAELERLEDQPPIPRRWN